MSNITDSETPASGGIDVDALLATPFKHAWGKSQRPGIDMVALRARPLRHAWGSAQAPSVALVPLAELPDAPASVLEALGPAELHDGRKHSICGGLGGLFRKVGLSRHKCEALIRAWLAPVAGPSCNVEHGVKYALGAWAKSASEVSGVEALAAHIGEKHAALVQQAVVAMRMPPRTAESANDSAAEPFKVVTGAPLADADADKYPKQSRSDLGNARRLVGRHGEKLRHCSARDVWLVWDGLRWADDETGEAMRCAKESAKSLWDEAKNEDDDEKRKSAFAWASQSQNAGRLDASIKLAKTEPEIAVRVSQLDSDPWLLNVQNGTLDLRTSELHDPDPALLMTKCCAAPFDAGARSDLWEAFVARTFGGDADLIAYVQRALGYALFGAWREKAFWFGYGPADGAKSTFFGAVASVLGDYHSTAAASTWMVQTNNGGNRGDLVRLLGARLVTTSEIREGARVDEETVKRVTGGDPIVAAAKYEGEIEFKPSFAMWWFANDPPIIRDDDGAMWSRARVVPFTHVVPKAEQDIHLPAKLVSDEHAPAVLAWLVAGCLAWQLEGLGSCAAVDAASQRYRADMNRLAGFVEAHLEITQDPKDEVPNRTMRTSYEQWCRDSGVRVPLQGEKFGKRLRELGVTGGDDASKKPVRGSGAPAPGGAALGGGKFDKAREATGKDRHWRGVKLRT